MIDSQVRKELLRGSDLGQPGYIDVAMVTWPNHPKRLEYFTRILDALRTHVTASRHTLRFHCSAESQRDPTRPWCGDQLEDLCAEYEVSLVWRDGGEPANLGANMNAAIALCTAPCILLQQDDWRLKKPLDLSDGADFLLSHRRVDLLRYSWPEDPSMLPTFIQQRGWRQIDVRGKWPYGDDPHLRRQDFQWRHGWYFEGGRHGSASGTLMKWLVKRGAVIAAADQTYFKHCGSVSSVLNDKRKRRVQR